jgi:hypothetical protein
MESLMIDGQSPVHNDFDTAAYPLTVYFPVTVKLRQVNYRYKCDPKN